MRGIVVGAYLNNSTTAIFAVSLTTPSASSSASTNRGKKGLNWSPCSLLIFGGVSLEADRAVANTPLQSNGWHSLSSVCFCWPRRHHGSISPHLGDMPSRHHLGTEQLGRDGALSGHRGGPKERE